jgi:hypothetical protein
MSDPIDPNEIEKVRHALKEAQLASRSSCGIGISPEAQEQVLRSLREQSNNLRGAARGFIASSPDLAPPTTQQGIKHDQAKLPWHLLPYDAIEQVVKVLNFGANKYEDRNWEQGIAYSRLFAASQRHLTSWFQNREDLDPESNLNHLAHAACCVLFALALELRDSTKPELDDRPRTQG